MQVLVVLIAIRFLALTAGELKHPEVIAIWEPMAPLCESREGQPAMWFPHVERLQLS